MAQKHNVSEDEQQMCVDCKAASKQQLLKVNVWTLLSRIRVLHGPCSYHKQITDDHCMFMLTTHNCALTDLLFFRQPRSAMSSPPESPEDEELAVFLQRNVRANVVEKGEEEKGVEEDKDGGKDGGIVEEEKKIEEEKKEVYEDVKLEVKKEVEEEEEEDEWQNWYWWEGDGDGQEEDEPQEEEEVASPKTPEAADGDPWKSMGLCKPPHPPRKKSRGLGATKRHNSNLRQNERNLAKRLMGQRHGASRWSSSSWWTSSSSAWSGWRGSSAPSWRSWSDNSQWSADHDGWGGSSSSTTRLLEKALDKIPDAR